MLLCYFEKQPFLPSSSKYYEGFGSGFGEWKISNQTNGLLSVDTISFTEIDSKQTALVIKSSNSKFAISTKFRKDVRRQNDTFMFQYEVLIPKKTQCTGFAIKLISDPSFSQANFSNTTNYSIRFGPDVCGLSQQIHLEMYINGTKFTLIKPPRPKVDSYFHLYGFAIYPNDTYSVFIDNNLVRGGNMLTDFDPPFSSKTIIDPQATKPADWSDSAFIIDTSQEIPQDINQPVFIRNYLTQRTPPPGWDERLDEMVSDSSATPPPSWDEECLGPWEPPKVFNPQCIGRPGCGKYTPPYIFNPNKASLQHKLIHNPDYKGPWVPPTIPNPNIVQHPSDLPVFTALGIEAMSVDAGGAFANILITTNVVETMKWNEGRKYYNPTRTPFPPLSPPPVDYIRTYFEIFMDFYTYWPVFVHFSFLFLAFFLLFDLFSPKSSILKMLLSFLKNS